jgi:hypothetical protein
MDSVFLSPPWVSALLANPEFAALLKGGISVVCVAGVLQLARRWGSRAAGIVAALPFAAAPALVWLATKEAPDYALRAASNAMWASAAYAFFALVYSLMCTRFRALPTLLAALLASVIAVILLTAWPTSRTQTLFFSLALCAAIRHFMPRPATAEMPLASSSSAVINTALVSGIVCAAIIYLSDFLPAQWAGVLACAPVVGAALSFSAHRRLSIGATQSMLLGYVDGCASRIVYCYVFAYLLREHGVAIATIAAMAACIATALALNVRQLLATDRVARIRLRLQRSALR